MDSRQVIDLFGFIGLHQIGSVLSCLILIGGKGRRLSYPPTALFVCLVAARVATSQAEALKIIRANWEECRTRYFNRCGVMLPRVPPTYEQAENHHVTRSLTRTTPSAATVRAAAVCHDVAGSRAGFP